MQQAGLVHAHPVTDAVAAISVGMIDGEPRLDLPYEEDVRAETDMNVVMTGSGRFVEVQGTAEREAFSRDELNSLLDIVVVASPRSSPSSGRWCWCRRHR